jgi:hypothetical protein
MSSRVGGFGKGNSDLWAMVPVPEEVVSGDEDLIVVDSKQSSGRGALQGRASGPRGGGRENSDGKVSVSGGKQPAKSPPKTPPVDQRLKTCEERIKLAAQRRFEILCEDFDLEIARISTPMRYEALNPEVAKKWSALQIDSEQSVEEKMALVSSMAPMIILEDRKRNGEIHSIIANVNYQFVMKKKIDEGVDFLRGVEGEKPSLKSLNQGVQQNVLALYSEFLQLYRRAEAKASVVFQSRGDHSVQSIQELLQLLSFIDEHPYQFLLQGGYNLETDTLIQNIAKMQVEIGRIRDEKCDQYVQSISAELLKPKQDMDFIHLRSLKVQANALLKTDITESERVIGSRRDLERILTKLSEYPQVLNDSEVVDLLKSESVDSLRFREVLARGREILAQPDGNYPALKKAIEAIDHPQKSGNGLSGVIGGGMVVIAVAALAFMFFGKEKSGDSAAQIMKGVSGKR